MFSLTLGTVKLKVVCTGLLRCYSFGVELPLSSKQCATIDRLDSLTYSLFFDLFGKRHEVKERCEVESDCTYTRLRII